jgi:hypothetical protein
LPDPARQARKDATSSTIERSIGWRVAAAALLLVPAVASRGAHDEGIEVRNASTRLQAGVWFLDADIDYSLNEATLEALENGLALDIELTIRLTQRRRLIWDPLHAELKQRYQLQFHALTERYIVRNLNSGEQISFRRWPRRWPRSARCARCRSSTTPC